MPGSHLLIFVLVILAGCAKDEPTIHQGDDEDVDVSAPDDMHVDRDASADTGRDEGVVPDDVGSNDLGSDMGDVGDMGEMRDPFGQSGSRLQRRLLEAEGGGRIRLDFWDTELEVACQFYDFEGVAQCRPNPSAAEPVVFEDSACTAPLYLDQGRCGQGWAYNGRTREHYRNTGVETTVVERFRLDADLNCVAELVDAGDVHFVAELVAETDFVAGTYVDEARTSGMSARYVEGEDGSRQFVTAIDTAFDVPCDFFESTGRCLPDVPAVPYTDFADPDCNEPILSLYPRAVGASLVKVFEYEDGCRSGTSYFVPGMPATTVYRDVGGVCQEFTPRADTEYVRVERPVPVAEFPTPTSATQGDGPLLAEYFADENGDPVSDKFRFRDGSTTCSGYEVDGEDTIRCVDWEVAYDRGTYYADDGCTTSLASVRCQPDATTVMNLGSGHQCDIPSLNTLTDIFPVAAIHSTDAYEGTPGACDVADPGEQNTLYELGASVLGTLPTLTVVTE